MLHNYRPRETGISLKDFDSAQKIGALAVNNIIPGVMGVGELVALVKAKSLPDFIKIGVKLGTKRYKQSRKILKVPLMALLATYLIKTSTEYPPITPKIPALTKTGYNLIDSFLSTGKLSESKLKSTIKVAGSPTDKVLLNFVELLGMFPKGKLKTTSAKPSGKPGGKKITVKAGSRGRPVIIKKVPAGAAKAPGVGAKNAASMGKLAGALPVEAPIETAPEKTGFFAKLLGVFGL